MRRISEWFVQQPLWLSESLDAPGGLIVEFAPGEQRRRDFCNSIEAATSSPLVDGVLVDGEALHAAPRWTRPAPLTTQPLACVELRG